MSCPLFVCTVQWGSDNVVGILGRAQGRPVMVSTANESLSYFVKSKKHQGGPWLVSVELDDAVRELHALVGNAVTQDKVIVVGIGSTQLFQAAMYALASRNGTSTLVVSESPYYTGYPQTIDSPAVEAFPLDWLLAGGNNNGVLVHDLAYYWPTYTPITMALDHDVMLFTLSKCTGHAGLRIGWAIVKDPEVAKKMAEFIIVTTICTSQDAQYRAAGMGLLACEPDVDLLVKHLTSLK